MPTLQSAQQAYRMDASKATKKGAARRQPPSHERSDGVEGQTTTIRGAQRHPADVGLRLDCQEKAPPPRGWVCRHGCGLPPTGRRLAVGPLRRFGDFVVRLRQLGS